MNLLADEGVDGPIVNRLRQEGHEVAYIAEMSPGIDDDTILHQANDNSALLLTLDKDCRCHFDPPGRTAAGNEGRSRCHSISRTR